MNLYERYANDKLWDETSCPFGTQVLNREAYKDDFMELYGLNEQLTAANIEFVQSEKHLYVDMSWEDEEPFDHLIESTIYSYNGYVYHVKMCRTDGCAGYTMTREPQFNKKYL